MAWDRHAIFAHIAESTTENGACNLHLPWSKTKKGSRWWHVGSMSRTPIRSHPCYSQALYQEQAQHPPSYRLLSQWAEQHSHTDTIYVYMMHQWHSEINKQKISMHFGSLLQDRWYNIYLISGVPPDVVKKFGCWWSQAFLEYWRCLNYLSAIHIEMLLLKPHLWSFPKAWLLWVSLHHNYHAP